MTMGIIKRMSVNDRIIVRNTDYNSDLNDMLMIITVITAEVIKSSKQKCC